MYLLRGKDVPGGRDSGFSFETPPVVMHEVRMPAENDWGVCSKCKYCMTPDAGEFLKKPMAPHFAYFKGVHDYLEGETDPAKVVYIEEAPDMLCIADNLPFTDPPGRLLFQTWHSMWAAPEENGSSVLDMDDADDGTEPDVPLYDAPPPLLLLHAYRCPQNDTGTVSVAVWKKCAKTYLLPLLLDPSIVADDALVIVAGAVAWKAWHSIATNAGAPAGIVSVHGKPVKSTIGGRTFTVVPVLRNAHVLANMDTMQDSFLEDYNSVYAALSGHTDIYTSAALLSDISKHEIYFNEMPPFSDLESIVAAMADMAQGYVSFDIETKTKDTATYNNYPTLMGFGFSERNYVQFSDGAYASVPYIFRRLRDLGIGITGQNIKFDLLSCYKFRMIDTIDDLPNWRDTHWLQALVDENKSAKGKADLKTLLSAYFNWPDYSIEIDSYVKNIAKGDWGKIPIDMLRPYNAADLVGTWMLDKHLAKLCGEPEVSQFWEIDYVSFYSEMDRNLLSAMFNGFAIDPFYLDPLTENYASRLKGIQDFFRTVTYSSLIRSWTALSVDMKATVKKSIMSVPFQIDPDVDIDAFLFNPNSTDHAVALLAYLVENKHKQGILAVLGKDAYTKTGALCVDKANMPRIIEYLKSVNSHPDVVAGLEKVAEYREMATLVSRYIEGMRPLMWADERVRSTFVVSGAATSRLAARNPNIQNIPKNKVVKNMFVVGTKGWLLLNFDLSQAEVRFLGSATGDKELAKVYREGLDMHKYVASKAFEVPYEEVTKDQRQASKSLQFGAIYGSSAAGIAGSAGIPLSRAEKLLENYFEKFPAVRPWVDQQHASMEQDGYVVGTLGRKRRLPHHLSHEQNLSDLKREAQNYPIQNGASDFNMLLMNRLLELIRGYPEARHGYKFVNTVHDSLVFEVEPTLAPLLYDVYKKAVSDVNAFFVSVMEGSGKKYIKQWIDFVGEAEIGPRYGEMYPLVEDEEGRLTLMLPQPDGEGGETVIGFPYESAWQAILREG